MEKPAESGPQGRVEARLQRGRWSILRHDRVPRPLSAGFSNGLRPPEPQAGSAQDEARVERRVSSIRRWYHKLLGTNAWFVIHHTDCGMELFADEVMAELLDDDLGTASFDGTTWSNAKHEGGCSTGHYLKWHTITDQAASVVQDVRRIHEHPLVPKTIAIHGYIYDVKTGRLNAVSGATIGSTAP